MKDTLRVLGRGLVLAVILALGLYFTAVRPMGSDFGRVPGGLVDARFNNYVLEHFYLWLAGFEESLWNPASFYPFPHVLAFSENMIGSAPFYSLLRWAGLGRESAYQGWYLLGYVLNYTAAAYALSRLRFPRLAAGVGAFCFAFGLPVLAQETHAQLLYRFAAPMACLSIWNLHTSPRLRTFAQVGFWTAWQLYMGLYTGLFLVMLLSALAIALCFVPPTGSPRHLFDYWPRKVQIAWMTARPRERTLALLALGACTAALALLALPYLQVMRTYGFSRSWEEVVTMLPRWESYLLADRSLVWRPLSRLIQGVPMRHEHQLFPGLMALVLAVLGVFLRANTETLRVARLHLAGGVAVAVITFSIEGYSLYYPLHTLPGLIGLRAVTRVGLVLMWPLGVLVAAGLTQLLEGGVRQALLSTGAAYLAVAALLGETIPFSLDTYSKAAAQARLAGLRERIPAGLSGQAILVVASTGGDRWQVSEVDSMLLAQELGWPALNGYSGNFAPGYGSPTGCSAAPKRIISHMHFSGLSSRAFYDRIVDRVVPLGFADCDVDAWASMPNIVPYAGLLPADAIPEIVFRVLSVTGEGGQIILQVQVTNGWSARLPALSTTQQPVLFYSRFVDAVRHKPATSFQVAADLPADILPGESATIHVALRAPREPGTYRVEIGAMQEGLGWFHDLGGEIARSDARIDVNSQLGVTIAP